MCLVYTAYCQKCCRYLRNYRRWPKFCGQATCVKLQHVIRWTLTLPCPESESCTPETCGTVETNIKLTCQDCYVNGKKRAKPLGGPSYKPEGLSGPGVEVTEEGRDRQPLSLPPR